MNKSTFEKNLVAEKCEKPEKCGRNFDLKSELTKHEEIHTDKQNPFSPN